MAGIGPFSIVTGSAPATAKAWNRARGFRPSSSAFSALMMSTADAPSEICEELPAVIDAVLLEGGLELGEPLGGGALADALVGGEHRSAAVELDRRPG